MSAPSRFHRPSADRAVPDWRQAVRELDDRVAVVTGAASGIGLALAERFAAERMKVVLADVDQAQLDEAVRRLLASGAEALGVRTDVSVAADIDRLAARTVQEFGAAHVLCNNAGVDTGAPFSEIPLASWDWVFGVNFRGVLYGCRAFLPLIRPQGEQARLRWMTDNVSPPPRSGRPAISRTRRVPVLPKSPRTRSNASPATRRDVP